MVLAMQAAILETADEVIDALGGTTAAALITGQALATVSNWRARKRIPPEHFLTVSKSLDVIGMAVAPDVFGMKTPHEVRGGEPSAA